MESTATPSSRRLLHTREIVCKGYLRDDGLLDVESTMRDISPNGSDLFFKPLGPGEDLHRMRIVMTVDNQLVIRAMEVHSEAAPTPYCAESNANYDALVGLKIGAGFTKRVRNLVGGNKGCTHLTELMGPAATTAMQTWFALGRERGGLRTLLAVPGPLPKPALADTCQAYRSGGKALEAIWPLERRAG